MGLFANVAAAEISLELPFGTFLFRLPPARIAQVQEARGVRFQYPDGSTGKRPKPIGTIVREHLAGVLGDVPNEFLVDDYTGDHDGADSREVIIQALQGGGMADMDARRLVIDNIDPWPENERWKLATAILVACVRGYIPPTQPGEDSDQGNAEAAGATTSSTTPPPLET